MSTETYNGWTNYSTWCVALWLGNDQGTDCLTRETVESGGADALRDLVRDELAPDLGASFASDLLGYALDLVNWHEIAAVYTQEDETESVAPSIV